MSSGPGDQSYESETLLYPSICVVHERLIVRYQDATELDRFLEVIGIDSIFRKGIDPSNNVPPGPPESFHKLPANVVVGVERETTSHASASAK